MAISPEDFNFLANLIKERSGIALSEDKEYLLEGRLLPIAKKKNFASIGDFVVSIKQNMNPDMIVEIVEAMTTNESFFFRDIKPFERLKDVVVPAVLEANPGKNNLRIWCAACSTGQEPYSVAISMLENPAMAGKTFEIIATDIDKQVVQKAKDGIYSQFEVQRGMTIPLLIKYFTQAETKWQVKPEVKDKIEFKTFNLLDDSAEFGTLDIIFCRNVLIYFDVETKTKVLNYMANRMTPSSALFMGAAESLVGINSKLVPYKSISGIFGLQSGDTAPKD